MLNDQQRQKFNEIWKSDSLFIVNVIRIIIAAIVIIFGIIIYLSYILIQYILVFLGYFVFYRLIKTIGYLIEPTLRLLEGFGRQLYKYIITPIIKIIQLIYRISLTGIQAIVQSIALLFKLIFKKILKLSRIKKFFLKILLYFIFPEIKLLEGIWFLIDSLALVCEKIWDGIDIIQTYSGIFAVKVFSPFGGGILNFIIALKQSRFTEFVSTISLKLGQIVGQALVKGLKIIYEILRFLCLVLYYIFVFLNYLIVAIVYLVKKLFKILAIRELYGIIKSATKLILSFIRNGLATLFGFIMVPLLLVVSLVQPIVMFIGVTIKESFKLVGKSIIFILDVVKSIFS